MAAHPTAPADPPATPALEAVFRELRVIRDLLEQRYKPLLTVTEVAQLVGRDQYTIRRWIKEQKLTATRVSGTGPKGKLLLRREEVEALLTGARAPEGGR